MLARIVRYVEPGRIVLREEATFQREVLRLEPEDRRERERRVGTAEPRRRILHVEPRTTQHRTDGENVADVHARTHTLNRGVHAQRTVLVGTENETAAVLVVKVADCHEEVVVRPAGVLVGDLSPLELVLVTAQHGRIELALHTGAELPARVVQFEVVVGPEPVLGQRIGKIVYHTVLHIPDGIGFETARKPAVVGGLLGMRHTGRHHGRST